MSMRSLAEAATRGRDNFSWLRHVAALMVLWAHGYQLSASGLVEPLARVLAGFDAGRFAVYLFFAVSGYLIALSLNRNDAILRYAWHRALRIYPAYALCLLVCVFVVGATFTRLTLSDYLSHRETWRYFAHNWLPISLQYGLPGVFETNPTAAVVNGSLWSLGAEVRWYFFFGVLALFGLFRHRAWFTLVACSLMALGLWQKGLARTEAIDSAAITQLFLLAALAALWRDVLPLSWRLLGGLLLLTGLLLHTRLGGSLLVLASIYLALCIAYRLPALPTLERDYSYGIFLYGYPMQQSLLALWPELAPGWIFLGGALLATAWAALSWHLLEQPALRLKPLANGLVVSALWRRPIIAGR